LGLVVEIQASITEAGLPDFNEERKTMLQQRADAIASSPSARSQCQPNPVRNPSARAQVVDRAGASLKVLLERRSDL